MQSEITFSKAIAPTHAAYRPKILRKVKFYGGWDEHLPEYEKYINWISYGVIAVAALFFLPVCIAIVTR